MRIKLRTKLWKDFFRQILKERTDSEHWRNLKDIFGVCGLSAIKNGNKIRGKIYLKISNIYFKKEKASQK